MKSVRLAGENFVPKIYEKLQNRKEEKTIGFQNIIETAVKDMGLRKTFCRGVHCEQYNTYKMAGDYSEQRHYYGDENNQAMVESPNVYYVSASEKESEDFVKPYSLNFTQYENGSIIYEENYTETEAIERIINVCEESRNDLTNELFNLEVPISPSTNDYRLTDSEEIDDAAYAKAFELYQNEVNKFDAKLNELNNMIIGVQNEIEQLQSKKNEIEITNNISNVSENIEQLKQTLLQNEPIIIQELEVEANRLKESMLSDNSNILQAKVQITELYSQRLNVQIPSPPATGEYVLDDGSIDENGYNKAYTDYVQACDAYDAKTAELDSKIAELNKKLENNSIEQQNNYTDLEMLRDNINNFFNITLYDSAVAIQSDKLNQGDKITELNVLQQEYHELKDKYLEIMQEKLLMRRKINITNMKNLALDIPTPPSTRNYEDEDGNLDEIQYARAFAEYEKQCGFCDEQSKLFSSQMNSLSNKILTFDNELYSVSNKIKRLIVT